VPKNQPAKKKAKAITVKVKNLKNLVLMAFLSVVGGEAWSGFRSLCCGL
jgi:hypothetical protein